MTPGLPLKSPLTRTDNRSNSAGQIISKPKPSSRKAAALRSASGSKSKTRVTALKNNAIVENEIKTQQGHGKFVGREPKGAVNRALSQWKEITAPRKVERTGIPATGV